MGIPERVAEDACRGRTLAGAGWVSRAVTRALSGPGLRTPWGGRRGNRYPPPPFGRLVLLARGSPPLWEATPPAPLGEWSGAGRVAMPEARAMPGGSLGAGA